MTMQWLKKELQDPATAYSDLQIRENIEQQAASGCQTIATALIQLWSFLAV